MLYASAKSIVVANTLVLPTDASGILFILENSSAAQGENIGYGNGHS